MAIPWVRPWSQKGSQDTLFTKFLEHPQSHGSAQSQVNNSPRRSKGHLSLGMMQHMTTQLGFSVMEPKNNGAAIRWATISSGNISFVIRSTRPHLSPIPPLRHYGLSARTLRLHKPPNIRYCAAHDDMGAGIAVNALGHAHPKLVQALTDQAQDLWHVSNLYHIPAQQKLADMLVEKTFADTVFFTNSGTESCELAVKMARKYWHDKGQPDRTEIICFNGAFHGRSSAGIAAAGSEKMTKGFGPLLPGFTHLDMGDHDALTKAAKAGNIAAIMVEPVVGEGGIIPLPDACLKQFPRRGKPQGGPAAEAPDNSRKKPRLTFICPKQLHGGLGV